jgi:phenylpyruvate tautomerase PptA (4-oxalocrotonate tautomerase family)
LPARPRNVAASVRNAANFAGSLTFECSITVDMPSRGNPSTGPISINPGGAIRRASGATASPARAAGGKSLAEQQLASYWIDVHVSEGTHTKDEKAAYLAAVFARMGELLGPLHNETYLHVDEVKGDAYGFGGLTQERRYIAGKLKVSPQRAAA